MEDSKLEYFESLAFEESNCSLASSRPQLQYDNNKDYFVHQLDSIDSPATIVILNNNYSNKNHDGAPSSFWSFDNYNNPLSPFQPIYNNYSSSSSSNNNNNNHHHHHHQKDNNMSDWEDMEDRLAILLENDPDRLQLFRSVHAAGVRHPAVLASLAYLSTTMTSTDDEDDHHRDDNDDKNMRRCRTTANKTHYGGGYHRHPKQHNSFFQPDHASPIYSASVEILAQFLASSPSSSSLSHQTQFSCTDQITTAKIATLRLLLTLRSPLTAGWQLEESAIEDTLHFVLGTEKEKIRILLQKNTTTNNNTNDGSMNIDKDATTMCSSQQQQSKNIKGASESRLLQINQELYKSRVFRALFFAHNANHHHHHHHHRPSNNNNTQQRAILHSESVLLWELRALCVHYQTQQQQQQTLAKRIQASADCVSEKLYQTARLMDTGLMHSTNFVTQHVLEGAGQWICQQLVGEECDDNDEDAAADNDDDESAANNEKEASFEQSQTPSSLPVVEKLKARPVAATTKAEIVAKTYSDVARRATDSTRVTTKQVVAGIRDASTKGIHIVAEKLHHEQVPEKIIPDKDHRTIAAAVGQVGMASLGAATIVGEAMLESTKQVAQTFASVSARIVERKYGPSAGQTVRDVAATTGNVISTVGNVAMLHAQVLAKIIAKNAGKHHLVSKHGDEGSFERKKLS